MLPIAVFECQTTDKHSRKEANFSTDAKKMIIKNKSALYNCERDWLVKCSNLTQISTENRR